MTLKAFLKALLYFRDFVNFALSQVLFSIRTVKRVWFARLYHIILQPTGHVMHHQFNIQQL